VSMSARYLFVTVFAEIIVDLTAVPAFINQVLSVLILYNHAGHVVHKIAKVVVANLQQFIVLVHQKQLLKDPLHFIFELFAELHDD